MGRIFDITLSCGCLISLDKGGAWIPCFKGKLCRWKQEYKTAHLDASLKREQEEI